MTEKEKGRLGEAIDEAIKHTLIDLGGEVLTLGEAIRKYRGGNYLATKWRKCSDGQPETPRNALVCRLGYVDYGFWDGKDWCIEHESALIPMQIQPTHWMNLPLPPVPEDEA